jgi:hypothetical protein
MLQKPLQRSSPIQRLKPLACDPFLRRLAQLDLDVAVCQALTQLTHEQVDNLFDLTCGDFFTQQTMATRFASRAHLFRRQPLLQGWHAAMTQLSSAIEIVSALGLLDVAAYLFECFAQLAHFANGTCFRFPLGV